MRSQGKHNSSPRDLGQTLRGRAKSTAPRGRPFVDMTNGIAGKGQKSKSFGSPLPRAKFQIAPASRLVERLSNSYTENPIFLFPKRKKRTVGEPSFHAPNHDRTPRARGGVPWRPYLARPWSRRPLPHPMPLRDERRRMRSVARISLMCISLAKNCGNDWLDSTCRNVWSKSMNS